MTSSRRSEIAAGAAAELRLVLFLALLSRLPPSPPATERLRANEAQSMPTCRVKLAEPEE